jgi:hypothetical protein
MHGRPSLLDRRGIRLGGVVMVKPNSPARLPAPSIVAPPAFPGLALAVPVEVANQIEASLELARQGNFVELAYVGRRDDIDVPVFQKNRMPRQLDD